MSALRHTHRQATCARLSLRTPAGSIRRSWQPARRCSAAAAQQHQQAQHESQAALERQSPTSSSSPPSSLLTATAFTLLAPLLRVPAAWADEAEDIVIEQVDALEAESLSKVVQAVQEEQSLYDTLVSIIFTGVVLALTVVTLGVRRQALQSLCTRTRHWEQAVALARQRRRLPLNSAAPTAHTERAALSAQCVFQSI